MKREKYLFTLVAAATVSLFWIVPDWPFAHLDDPSHWGIVGYAVTFLFVAGRMLGWVSSIRERRCLVFFLAGMPLIYVANWVRFGDSSAWLAIELFGLILYGGAAWLSIRRFPPLLPGGILAHALWDLAHFDAADFVPNWYALGCLVVDSALGLYVAGVPRPRGPRDGGSKA